MPRPRCCRRIRCTPRAHTFEPADLAPEKDEPVHLTLDEFEALRLADYEGLYHEEAARLMEISRPTFTRLISSARQKVAAMLVEGRSLFVKGGEIKMVEETNQRTFVCDDCGHKWQLAHGTGCPRECPECHSPNVHRDPTECRHHRAQHGRHGEAGGPGGGKGHGRCCRRRTAKSS